MRHEQLLRRTIDVAAASVGLLLLAPLLAAIALVILCRDGRPVFFRQIRIGRFGKPFRIWKFRTMRRMPSGAKVTAEADSRVTGTGSTLRRYKLDELPQLFNVLVGEMSLIGPRPEVPEFVQSEDPRWRAVLSVNPGITDVASLLYRDEEALLGRRRDPETYYREVVLPAKLEINMRHLHSRTLLSDFRLLLATMRCSFFPAADDAQRLRKIYSFEGPNS